jgi:hypothetical protein
MVQSKIVQFTIYSGQPILEVMYYRTSGDEFKAARRDGNKHCIQNKKEDNVKDRDENETETNGAADHKATFESLLVRIDLLESAVERLLYREFYENLADLSAYGVTTTQEDFSHQNRFIRETGNGWLVAAIDDRKGFLPSGISVSLKKTCEGRDYGIVREGILSGASFIVASGNIEFNYPRLENVEIKVEKKDTGIVQTAEFEYDIEISIDFLESGQPKSIGPFPATIDPDNPLPVGSYDVEIADFPHDRGVGYGPYGTVWFRIGHSGSRYLHPGKCSDGSISCAPCHWTEIFQILHSARVNNKCVAKLEFRAPL